MSEPIQILLLGCVGSALLLVGGRLIRHLTARRALYREFQEGGASIAQIQTFRGFLDVGSLWRAMTSTGYEVVLDTEGGDSRVFCLVRHLPVFGLVWALERWDNGAQTRIN